MAALAIATVAVGCREDAIVGHDTDTDTNAGKEVEVPATINPMSREENQADPVSPTMLKQKRMVQEISAAKGNMKGFVLTLS